MGNAIFTGVRAKWLPLYKQLYDRVMGAVGPFEEYETANAIQWKHNSTFAEVRAKKDGMVIAFASDKIHDDWNASKVLQTSKNRVAHYFEVTDDTLFSVFTERISQAYQLTQSSRPRKEPADKPQYTTIDEYIALFPAEVQEILKKIRATVHEAAPDAQEKISWQMPTFWQHENLVHFAAHQSHIGFYPGASGVEAFVDKLKEYKASKGTIQFPFSKPIPYELIRGITRFRVNEIMRKHE
jgi:uncharacterized protein YdhG (YjbR/CyaY superfamily)